VIDFENAVESLLRREAFEETGVEIGQKLEYINSVAFVRPDGIPVVLVKFAARYISGEVQPEKGSFTDYAWVNEGEVKSYSCIGGVPEEVIQTIKLFSKLGIVLA
jgi:NADH pyrophosphatase NudC (nudix superfamily)